MLTQPPPASAANGKSTGVKQSVGTPIVLCSAKTGERWKDKPLRLRMGSCHKSCIFGSPSDAPDRALIILYTTDLKERFWRWQLYSS